MIMSGIMPKAVIALIVAIPVAFLLGVYKGNAWCETDYASAANKQKDASRGEIIKSGKKYETVRKKVAEIKGENGAVGPRITVAIDSLP